MLSFAAAKPNEYAQKNLKQRPLIKNKNVVHFLHRHVPITKWLPKYSSEKAIGDLIAGVTIGLTMIPQSIAYASLANLSPQV